MRLNATLAGLAGFAGTLLLSACAGLPPARTPLVLPSSAPLASDSPAGAAAGTATLAAAAGWPAQDWWRQFNDPTLDALIAQGLAGSPNIAAATARFDAARAGLEATRASSGLQANANGTATRQRLSDNGLFPPAFLGFNWYNQFDLGLAASYSFDWWGTHRAQIAAALDTRQAALAERAAAELALASSIAEVYYGWQCDTARQELVHARISAAEQRLQIVTARHGADIAGDDDLQQARLDLLAERDHGAEVDTSAQLRRVTLAALLGVVPAQLPPLTPRPLPVLHTELPANATIDLLARRPEIAASRWRVEAAARNLDVARGGFMPDISLRALAGVSSLDLGKLLQAGSGVPAISGAVHLPLFDGGALRAGYARNEAELDAALAEYRRGIVDAAREVNSGLATRAQWLTQADLRREQLAAAAAVRDSAAQRVAQGITDARPQLRALDDYLALREADLQTQYARLLAELRLIRALGGGYQMETKP